jgi:hypothetical protein
LRRVSDNALGQSRTAESRRAEQIEQSRAEQKESEMKRRLDERQRVAMDATRLYLTLLSGVMHDSRP